MSDTATRTERNARFSQRPSALAQVETRLILDVDVLVLNRADAIDRIANAIRHGNHRPVAFLNANGANIAVHNADYREALRGFEVLADGIGVDAASRLLYGRAFPTNLNGTDFLPALLKYLDGPLTVGLFGAAPNVAALAADALKRIAPQHHYRALADGYVNDAQQAAMVDRLAGDPVDILLVALGNPRQEIWVAQNIGMAHATVPICVGALFDFLAGEVARAPQWMIDMRIEWLFRLLQEPGRLWRRYILGNPVFLARVLRQKLLRR